MNRISRIFIGAFLCVSCTPSLDFELDAQSDHLAAKATITEIEFAFQDKYTKLSGIAKITNSSSVVQKYSNKWLWLSSGEEFKSRAYLDNITSNIVDVGTVEIKPNDTLDLNVYWIFPDSDKGELGDGEFVLELDLPIGD